MVNSKFYYAVIYNNQQTVSQAIESVLGQGYLNIEYQITGKDPSDAVYLNELKSLVVELKLQNRIEFLGWIPHDELPSYYASAAAFVFPSKVESFGLSIMEAMAMGIPTITSNRMAVPEVAGSAGLVIDPNNHAEFSCALEKILCDASSARDPEKCWKGKCSAVFMGKNSQRVLKVTKYEVEKTRKDRGEV